MYRLKIFVTICIVGVSVYASPARAANMLGHWALDETTQGSTVVDSGVGGNNGTPSGSGGGPSPSTNVPTVNFSNPRSYSFNGSNQYVQIASSFTSAVSVTFWFRPLANGSGGGNDNWYNGTGLFDAEIGGVTNDFGVTWSANHVEFGIGNPDVTIHSGALALDTWHHVAATWQKSDGAMKLYIDGSLVDSSGSGSHNNRISTNVRFGVLLSGVNAYYQGYMDDIRTYDVALDASQVASMASGNAISDPVTVSFSPADDATNVDPSSTISITFGTTTAATSTGAIGIYKTTDNSLLESISLSSSEIVRSTTSASTTFTVTSNTARAASTGYYLSIASTTFVYGTGNFWEGTGASTTWNFTTGDFTAPTISGIGTTTATTTSTITWTTDEAASTKVVYSSDTLYASTTSETDTSPRVTSHSKGLSNLVACTLYNFKAVSADAAGNYATSSSSNFTTTGCSGGAIPSSATSTTVTVSSAATSTITDSGRTLTVATPANFTATSSSVVIQIKGLPSSTVLDSIGKPSNTLSSAASLAFDVTALINNSTTLDSFDTPVTISYTYTDSDVSGLDESSLTMYHYHGSAWLRLDNCSVNTSTNTLTCSAPSFSTFAIFGTPSSSSSSSSSSTGGSGMPWCSAPLAPGWNTSLPDGGCAKSATIPSPVLSEPQNLALCSKYRFTRQLRTGDKGEDVRALQAFLNCAGFTLGASGPGSRGNETTLFADRTLNALKKFQNAFASEILTPIGTTKATGIFGQYSQKKSYSLMNMQ